MKTIGWLVAFVTLLFNYACAQSTDYKFRVRYSNYSPLTSSPFIISGYRLTTDPQGIITAKFSDKISYVNIETVDKSDYEIRYPLEGRAILPKDESTFIDIYIEKKSTDPLKKIQAEIRSSQKDMQSAIISKLQEESRKGYNGIVELLNSKNANSAQLNNGRLEFFPLISAALNNYLNESRNLNDAFLSLSNALSSSSSYDQLRTAIYKYNEIFDLLNANKDIYEQAIATYWQSKELSLKFSNVIDFTIEEFHRPFILEINYSFIPRLQELNKQTNKNRKKELSQSLKTDMQNLSAIMLRRQLSLGERMTNLNTELKK